MSIYSLPNIIGALSVLGIGSLVFSRSNKSKIKFSFLILCLELFVWLISYAVTYSTKNKEIAFYFCRIACTSVMFTTPTIYLFFSCFLNKFEQERKYVFLCFLAMFVMFPFFVFTEYFLATPYHYPWGYYSKAGPLHPYYLIVWVAVWLKGLPMFFDAKMWTNISYIEKQRNKFALALYFIVTLGIVDYIPKYGVNLYPWGWVFEVIFASVFAYAIIKYRFMDITLAVTRTGIFVSVYSLILGIPFALAFAGREKLLAFFGQMWWMVPLVTSTVLATVGPFIYAFIQSRAEDRLFQEQRRYQTTLRQASTGMGKIKDLKKLVTLIVHIMTRTVRVEFSMVFLNDQRNKTFRLGAYRSREERVKFRGDIDYETAIVKTLQETQGPIVYDEIKQRAQDYEDLKLARLEAELKALDAAIVVPSFVDEKLLAILVMGNKLSGKMYTSDDLAVFSILANQSALAIENAQFYEDMKMTHAQLMKAEKMATIGILADGLSHQINNRLHAMGFIAGDALDTLKIKHNLPMSLEVKEMMLDIEHALNRIESNVQQGGEIVQGLLKYSRKDDESITAVELDKLIQAALEMTQFKIKPGEMAVQQDFTSELPKIRGNFTQLQEVFFNLIDNAYDAMMQRKAELKEPGYKPLIKITASSENNGYLNILFEDNGIGIKDDDKEKIFTPFFTTKLSSKKGTGLGLYVIQRLIEENHKGKVLYESIYKQGTKVHIALPTMTEAAAQRG